MKPVDSSSWFALLFVTATLATACHHGSSSAISDSAGAPATGRGGGAPAPSATASKGGSAASEAGAQDGATARAEGGAVGRTPYTLIAIDSRQAYSIAVDSTHIYWGDHGGWVKRALKDGSGALEPVSQSGGSPFSMTLTDTYVYWSDSSYVWRAPKAGGREEQVPLPFGAPGAVQSDSKYVYVAAPGCAAIARLDLSTHGAETTTVTKTFGYATGATYLYWEGSELYCGAWHRVFVMRAWGKLEELVTSAEQVWGIAFVRGKLVWVDQYGPQRELALYALDSGGPKLLGVVPDSANCYGSPLVADADRNRVLFTPTGTVEGIAVDTGVSTVLANTNSTHAITRDQDWLYWTTDSATIERMPITQQ